MYQAHQQHLAQQTVTSLTWNVKSKLPHQMIESMELFSWKKPMRQVGWEMTTMTAQNNGMRESQGKTRA